MRPYATNLDQPSYETVSDVRPQTVLYRRLIGRTSVRPYTVKDQIHVKIASGGLEFDPLSQGIPIFRK